MQQDEQAIRDLIDTWLKLSATGDVAPLLDLMAEDVVFLRSGHPPMRGRNEFEASVKAAVQNHKITTKSEIQEIKITGDWAYCWTRLTVNMNSPDAKQNTRSGYTLSIFHKRENGKWVLARDANMLT